MASRVEADYVIQISDERPSSDTRRAFIVETATDTELAGHSFFDGDPSLWWALNLIGEAEDHWKLQEKKKKQRLTINFCIVDGWVPTERIDLERVNKAFTALMENGPLGVDNVDGTRVRTTWGQRDPIDLLPFGVYEFYHLNALFWVIDSLNWDALREY